MGASKAEQKEYYLSLRSNSSGFTSFEEIQDIIVGVALVRPKPGGTAHVKHYAS